MRKRTILRLLNCFIARAKNNNRAIEQCKNRLGEVRYRLAPGEVLRRMVRGFTLIELLIIIAVLGVLSVGVLVAINPTGIINKANLGNVKTFAASVKNSVSINQVGEWSFDDSANPAKDTSGYGKDGTVVETSWQDANSCGLGFGGCMKFFGGKSITGGNYVDIPDYNFGSQSFTLLAWFLLESSITDQVDTYPIFGNYQNTPFLGFRPSPTIIWHLRQWDTSAQYISWYEVPYLADDKWHHIVLAVDQSTAPRIAKLYIDAKFYGVRNLSGTEGYTHNNGDLARIGKDYETSWQGLIDEVSIYNQPLTSYQIQQLYAQGLIKRHLAYK